MYINRNFIVYVGTKAPRWNPRVEWEHRNDGGYNWKE